MFLKTIATAGGVTAVWSTLDSWGLAKPARQDRPPLDGQVEGVRLIILGAGMGGLTVAYELGQLGYDIQILDALDRPGGHNWTVRRGTQFTEHGGETQVCEYDEGQYFNPGPWRIPHHHEAVLHYCRQLGVPLEVFVNYQAANYAYVEGDFGPLAGQPIRQRVIDAHMGGYTAELLAKFAQEQQLDEELTQEHIEQLVEYLANYGLLDDELRFTGTSRAGYASPPGAGMQPGERLETISFQDLLPYAAELLDAQGGYLAAVASYSQQMTMFQPVGGMDRIAYALAEAIGNDRFTFQAEVREIRQDESGVRIVYQDLASGETQEVTGDYCVCNIPLTILPTIPADFSPEMAEAIRSVPYQTTGKIGLQFGRRFWEEDEQIYGGETRTNIPSIGGIAYPSYGFFGQKGVLQGYYNFGLNAIEISNLSVQERIEHALEHGSKIHPQYRETFENGFSVAWHRVPYLLGGWPNYNDRIRTQYYPRLLEPDGRIYLVGEHLSHLTGWMEGSVRAAWMQMEKLHERVRGEQTS
ncbi:MAG: amine oxidase [Chloroflexi bacterium]|nr:MAG: amine oxidase [Chloroflexota bacterium]